MTVSRETASRLAKFEQLVGAENERQNLVSKATLPDFWVRHVEDGLQLVDLFPDATRSVLDIGSGAGLPGMVIACATDAQVTLCEPRALRVEFLRRAAAELALSNVTVAHSKVERLTGTFDVITARAVASLEALFAAAQHCAHDRTTWILPKGKSALEELEVARRSWQGEFSTVPSRTNPDAWVVVARKVRRRGGR